LPKDLGKSTIFIQTKSAQPMSDGRLNHQCKKLKAAGFAQPRLYHNVNNAPELETVEQLAKTEKICQSVEAKNLTHYPSLGIAIEISSNF
jgi:hypothetical protein